MSKQPNMQQNGNSRFPLDLYPPPVLMKKPVTCTIADWIKSLSRHIGLQPDDLILLYSSHFSGRFSLAFIFRYSAHYINICMSTSQESVCFHWRFCPSIFICLVVPVDSCHSTCLPQVMDREIFFLSTVASGNETATVKLPVTWKLKCRTGASHSPVPWGTYSGLGRCKLAYWKKNWSSYCGVLRFT